MLDVDVLSLDGEGLDAEYNGLLLRLQGVVRAAGTKQDTPERQGARFHLTEFSSRTRLVRWVEAMYGAPDHDRRRVLLEAYRLFLRQQELLDELAVHELLRRPPPEEVPT